MTFEQYVTSRGQALLRLAYLVTGDSHLAQDLTQSALANALRHWSKVESAQDPDAYVRRILVNEHLSWRRRRSTSERPTLHADHMVESLPDPADEIVLRDQIHRSLASLPPRARTVLVLRYYADLDDASIAKLIGVSVSGVRATASRALAALRAATQSRTLEGTR